MEQGNAGFTAIDVRRFSSAIARLCVLAAQEITSHTCKDGICVICATAWPCERAELAEHNLALL